MTTPVYQVGSWCQEYRVQISPTVASCSPGKRHYYAHFTYEGKETQASSETGPRPPSQLVAKLGLRFRSLSAKARPSLHVPTSHSLCEPCSLRAAMSGSEHPVTGGIQAAAGSQTLARCPGFLGWMCGYTVGRTLPSVNIQRC